MLLTAQGEVSYGSFTLYYNLPTKRVNYRINLTSYRNGKGLTEVYKLLENATTFSFINLVKSAQHVSGDKFAHPQEHFLALYKSFGTMHYNYKL